MSSPGQRSSGFACSHSKRFVSLNSSFTSPEANSVSMQHLSGPRGITAPLTSPWDLRDKRISHKQACAAHCAMSNEVLCLQPRGLQFSMTSMKPWQANVLTWKEGEVLTVLQNYFLRQFFLWFHMYPCYSQVTCITPSLNFLLLE